MQKNVFGLRPKNFHSGASLVSRKVHKLGLGMPKRNGTIDQCAAHEAVCTDMLLIYFFTFSKFDTCLNSLKPLFMYLFIHSFLPI